MRLIIIIFCFFQLKAISQNLSDSILDGSILLNLKQAKPNTYYKYKITDNYYTLLKFRNGTVVDYRFNSTPLNNVKIDTFYYPDKSGFSIKLNNKVKNPSNVLRISNSKDALYLCIAADDSTSQLYYGDRYYYYSNKQLSAVVKTNLTNKTSENIRYTPKGLLSDIEIRDSLNKLKEVTIYTKKGNIDWEMRVENNITIREQYDGKGNLLQIDSTNSEYKHVGTVVAFYLTKKVKRRTPYLDGKVNGINYIYYPDGDIKLMETYIEGKKSGKYIYYNKDGSIKKEGVFK